jgi:hypothetical protein
MPLETLTGIIQSPVEETKEIPWKEQNPTRYLRFSISGAHYHDFNPYFFEVNCLKKNMPKELATGDRITIFYKRSKRHNQGMVLAEKNMPEPMVHLEEISAEKIKMVSSQKGARIREKIISGTSAGIAIAVFSLILKSCFKKFS